MTRTTSSLRNRVRIVGGSWRGRTLAFPSVAGLRPTGDRIRETLFNWLGQTLTDRVALDAFAGSGALGFEAASRGARRVVLCERDGAARRALAANRERLGATQCDVAGDVFDVLRSTRDRFDLVFCDPPFAADLHRRFLLELAAHLADGAQVYVESPEPLAGLLDEPALAGLYRLTKSGWAGAVHYGLIQSVPNG